MRLKLPNKSNIIPLILGSICALGNNPWALWYLSILSLILWFLLVIKNDIPKKYLNVSAKKLLNKKKLIFFKKYIKNYNEIDFLDNNYNVAIITPDKDIIPGADTLNPAYIVFDNYEIILQWNRSLRFALAVCTLKNKFKDEL